MSFADKKKACLKKGIGLLNEASLWKKAFPIGPFPRFSTHPFLSFNLY